MKRKKTILYVGHMEFPDKNAAAIRVVENAKILESLGYEVVLLGIDRSRKMTGIDQVKKINNVAGFTAFSRAYPIGISQKLKYYSSAKWFAEFTREFDIDNVFAVIAYNFPAVPLHKLLNYSRKYNFRLLADCTEWYGFTKNPIVLLDTFFRMRFIHKEVKNIICVSNYIQEYYDKNNCNTVNIPTLSPHITFMSEKEDNDAGIKIFSYIGDPGKGKKKDRLDYIIKAFKSIKEDGYKFKFNIVGISEEKFVEIYPKHIDDLKFISEDVIFYGRLSRDEALKVLAKSDYSVFFREQSRVTMAGFPTKLGESFSLNTPVITNETSNINDFLVDGINGYLANEFSIENIENVLEKAIVANYRELNIMKSNIEKDNPLHFEKYISSLRLFINKM